MWNFGCPFKMGAAYSSLGRTKVLYATSFVLLGAKAKFLRRKRSVSEIVIPRYLLTERFPRLGCDGNSQRVSVCDADAESLSWSDIWPD